MGCCSKNQREKSAVKNEKPPTSSSALVSAVSQGTNLEEKPAADTITSEPTSPAKTNPTITSPTKTSPTKTSPTKTSPAKTNPTITSPTKTSPTKTIPTKTTLTPNDSTEAIVPDRRRLSLRFANYPRLPSKGRKSQTQYDKDLERWQEERSRGTNYIYEAVQDLEIENRKIEGELTECKEKTQALMDRKKDTEEKRLGRCDYYAQQIKVVDNLSQEIEERIRQAEQTISNQENEFTEIKVAHENKLKETDAHFQQLKDKMRADHTETVNLLVAKFDAYAQLKQTEEDITFLEKVLEDFKGRAVLTNELTNSLQKAGASLKPNNKVLPSKT